MYYVIPYQDWVYKKEDYDEQAIYQYITKWTDIDEPNPPCTRIIPSRKDYDAIINVASQHVPECEKPLHDKFIAKWNVPQGGKIAKYKQFQIAASYFTEDTPYDEIMIRRARERFNHTFFNSPFFTFYQTYITNDPRVLYNLYKADHPSSGSIIYDGDRREHECRVKSIRSAITDPHNFDAILSDSRRKDGKERGIHNDPLSNVYREMRLYAKIFQEWKNHPCDHSYSDLYLSYFITLFHAKGAYAGDYEAMDKHFWVRSAIHVVDCFCDVLHISHSEREEIKQFTRELFETDLIVADMVFSGAHSLLSGQYPTHDFEGPLNFNILDCALDEFGYRVVLEVRPLQSGEAFILVCGDDSIVLFGDELSEEQYLRFGEIHAKWAAVFHQKLELSKIDYSNTQITFCKKTLALNVNTPGFKKININGTHVPLWKSSLCKCVHALYEPESLPDSNWTISTYISWMCSIMDGAQGCSQYIPTLHQIFSRLPFVPRFEDFNSDAMERTVAILNKDWWFRTLSGFSLDMSPTFLELRKFFKF